MTVSNQYKQGVTIARRRVQDALTTVERDLDQIKVIQDLSNAGSYAIAKDIIEQVLGSLYIHERSNYDS